MAQKGFQNPQRSWLGSYKFLEGLASRMLVLAHFTMEVLLLAYAAR
jgi:hypothetical protein